MRLRRNRMRWLCATTTPWALGAGMLVSFTASAGQDLSVGVSAGPAPVKYAILDQDNLVPQAPGLVAATLGLTGGNSGLASLGPSRAGAAIRLASYTNDADLRLFPGPDEVGQAPRDDLKQQARRLPDPRFPEVQRQRKGDPQVALRSTLSRAGRDASWTRPATHAGKLLFTRDDRLLPRTILMEGPVEVPALEDVLRFETVDDENDGATTQQSAESSPIAPSAIATGPTEPADMAEAPEKAGTEKLFGSARRAAAFSWRRPSDARDGGTPATPRAMALGSATPAPPEATPMEIAAAPVIVAPGQNMSVVARLNPGRRSYAGLISPDHMAREQRCLAEAVYFEARSEPAAGQAAVAQVVLNRVKSGLYPTTVCGVVYQNRHRHNACQFSFACEGKRLVTNETAPWRQAVQIARAVYEGQTYVAEVGGATHYHADYVRPRWAKKLKKNDVIGRHIFYQLRPGQT